MPAESTGNFSKLLWPGINTIWGLAYKEYTPEFIEIFEEFASGKNFEEDQGLTGYGYAQEKSEGGAVSYDSSQIGFLKRYTHATYGLGFIITREMFEDDQYAGPMQRHTKALAYSMRQTKEVLGANVLNRAFNSDYVGGDSLELCSLLHTNKTGGTWANEPATPADLSETALEQACIDIAKYTNDRGMRIKVLPRKLIIPPDLEFTAGRILKSELQSDSAEHNINVLKAIGKIPDGYRVNHYLTDTNAWFVKTDAPDGFKYFNRRSDEFGEDNDFDTENAKYKATFRCSFGWTDPRCVYGSPG